MREGSIRTLAYVSLALLCLVSCNSNSLENSIVAVEVEDLATQNYEGATLIAIDPARPDRSARSISEDFTSACAPALSHDGRYLYFQARKTRTDPWQIWVRDLQKGSTKQVTELLEDCLHPVSLPDGSVIFSRSNSKNENSQSSLYRCRMDGSELTRITFTPGTHTHPTVLDEGRVLYLSHQLKPETGSPKLMIMRPDGTKSELYHLGYTGQQPQSGGIESEDGYIYFIREGASLARVSHKRPLHTVENLSRNMAGETSAVYPYLHSTLLLSHRPEGAGRYALYTYKADSKEEPVLLYEGEKDVTDPVWVRALKERPKILPSAVNMEKRSGLLMSQDINHSMLNIHPGLEGDSMATRIRVLGQDGTLGEVEVEADGSFYLVLDADTPVRIETLNGLGEVVRGPSDWIYLRPNERRACVGCHADHELAPDNTQPMAVKGEPVDLSTKKEKTSN